MIISTRRAIVFAAAIVLALCGGCASTSVAPDTEVINILAPTGKLRVGVYPGSPVSMIQDPTSKETKGVTYELGRELARRLGVPFEPVVLPRLADVIKAVQGGQADFFITNATADRARTIDFTSPLWQTEQGYLVLANSPLSHSADVDRQGIRVGVLQGSTSLKVLSDRLKNATVVSVPSLKIAMEMLSQGKIDAFATNKAILFELADNLLDSKVLDGRYGLERASIGIPKGRDKGLAYLHTFAENVTSKGLVRQAIDNARLRGTVDAQTR